VSLWPSTVALTLICFVPSSLQIRLDVLPGILRFIDCRWHRVYAPRLRKKLKYYGYFPPALSYLYIIDILGILYMKKSRSKSDKWFSIRPKIKCTETMILSRLQKSRLGSLDDCFFALATTKTPRTCLYACFSLPTKLYHEMTCPTSSPPKNRRKSKKRGPNRDRTGDFRMDWTAIPHWYLLVWLCCFLGGGCYEPLPLSYRPVVLFDRGIKIKLVYNAGDGG
jgi:hypothetical protein